MRIRRLMPTGPFEPAAVAILQRQIVQLGILMAVTVAAFVGIRAVAVSNRKTSLRDAADWYQRGQRALEAHRLDDAIDALRRASVRDRNNRSYAMALAQALAFNGDTEAARTALLTLRESAPEDVQVNLELARVAAAREDVTEAVRFYRSALYTPTAAGSPGVRRTIRLELIRFLLDHKQAGLADAELIALCAGLPDDLQLHLKAAHLLVEADDRAHALEQFQDALKLDPASTEGLSGAGTMAFELGDYPLAHRYLRHVTSGDADVLRTKETVALVLSKDPLAARLGTVERRRRFTAALSYTEQRLNDCLASQPSAAPDAGSALQADLQGFQQQLPPRGPLEQDVIEQGMDVIRRIETRIAAECGPATAMDRALLIIARAHAGESR